jgi:general secretion pathway protein H
MKSCAVKPCRGFTLVEILIVMIIVGVMASMAVLAIGGDPHQQLKQEAQRIRLVLQLAADEALLQGQEYGLKLARESYQVVQFDDEKEEWAEAPLEAFDAYQLPNDITLSLQSEGSTVDLTILNKNEEEQNQKSQEENELKPALLLLSSGEMTPFTLQLNSANADYKMQLSGDGLGEIRLGNQDAI